MKKLLSLLSVLTISGTTAPTTIAANPYKKEETIREKRQTQKPTNFKKEIYDFITVFYLGDLKDNYEDTILHAIERLNPRIRMNEIRIAQLFDRRARIVFADAPNNFQVNDSVLVSFNISSEGMTGNSRFYNISPDDINRSEISNPIFQHSTNEIKKLPIVSIGEQPGISGIQNRNKKIERPRIAPPTTPNPQIPVEKIEQEIHDKLNQLKLQYQQQNKNSDLTSKTEEPVYATILPKSQRKQDNNFLVPIARPRNLTSILLNTNLGELNDNFAETILNAVISLNPNINRNEIIIENITTTSAIIIPNQNSRYIGNLEVFFTLNYKDKQNLIKINDNEKDNDSNSNKNQNIKDIITKFNNLSKQSKQNKLNEINQHYQSLPEDEKKSFKDKLATIGTGAIGAGISVVGTKITVSGSASSTGTITSEAIEMTPLLSEEGLTAAETLSVAEGTITTAGTIQSGIYVTEIGTVAAESTVIGAEAGTAAALGPETLGLSLVIGGLVIAGTAIIWWFNGTNGDVTKHESHNQYNEIEKYYKFLAHDQLKLSISTDKWNKIKEIYEKTNKNYKIANDIITNFINECKKEINNFKKEDHSGWGGSIIDDDINTILAVIYFEFETINNHFLSNPNHGWKIITNTVGSYFIIEEE